MTAPKSPEEILADYTEDLVADRPPRLTEDVAALDEASRLEVLRLAALVRAVKAARSEAPAPSPEFLSRLDARLTAEIDQLSGKEAAAPGRLATPTGPDERSRPLRPWRDVVLGFASAWRWQLVGCAAAAILLLQGQLFLKVRGLQEENRNLLQRLERLAPLERMVPMRLPLEEGKGPAGTERLTGERAGPSLRALIEQRIKDLETESAATTGEDRKAIARAIQELRQLLQVPQGR